jgi:hypothetical protein
MHTHETSVAFAALVTVSLALACGSEDAPAIPGVGGGGSGGGALDGSLDGLAGHSVAGQSGSGGTVIVPDGGSCPSKILCGAQAVCCAPGTECIEGGCLTACGSGIRCGADQSSCCASGQVCVEAQCASPTGACKDSYDCAEQEFCEPTLGKCLPQPSGTASCEYRPPVSPFNPIIEWSWTSSTVKPTFVQVINMPVIVDLDQDDVPDVVIVTSEKYNPGEAGYLRALDGRTGAEKWSATADVYADANWVNPRGTPAAADIDGDGKVDIIAPRSGGGALAFNGDGSLKWRSTLSDGVTPYTEAMASVTVAVANLDQGQGPEIVLGGVVLDHLGRLVSGQGRGLAGTNATGYGAVSIVCDVDGDGVQDVVTGAAAWKIDGTQIWANGQADGYPAVTDFEQDGNPELVVISNGSVRVQNAMTGAVLATIDMPGDGMGGPPTIADFDADGVMEISSANGSSYNLFEYSATPSPQLTVKWHKDTQDLSSNVTGSSVFDFEGDGSAEVVYGDECFFRVYGGKDGTVLYETASSSATIHEYPVVVDVDGDNNTEIVVVANDYHHTNGTTTCPTYTAAQKPRHGVFVYGDANDKWVRTRRVWNQHAYHITNISSNGTLPSPEPPSWVSPPQFNNYRVSTQGAGVYNAPDLRVDLEVSSDPCPDGLDLRARVKNQGSLGVGPDIQVAFFRGKDASGTLLATKTTTRSLLPGQSEVVVHTFSLTGQNPPFDFFVAVDGTNAASGTINECNEDNNTASAGGVSCPLIQ